MRDVNYPLRKIYFAKLSAITYNGTPVKAFYQKAPDDISDANYIVYGAMSNNDVSAKHKFATDTSMQVTIHTYAQKYNDGMAADNIAGLVFDALYPDSGAIPDMAADNLQLLTTKLTNDTIIPYTLNNSREYLDRVLTFQHSIFQR